MASLNLIINHIQYLIYAAIDGDDTFTEYRGRFTSNTDEENINYFGGFLKSVGGNKC